MAWVNQDKCAIVGVGSTDYYVRGKSWPRTINDMAAEAIMNACADAGISHKQIGPLTPAVLKARMEEIL